MVGLTSAELTTVVVDLLIALFIARRSYNMTVGVAFSTARFAATLVLIFLVWALNEAESLLLIPWALPSLVALDTGILVASGLLLAGVAQRMTTVTQAPSGRWMIRVHFGLATGFLVLFVVRLVIAVALFPSSLEFGSVAGYPPESQQLVLAVIDALFSLSVGLLVARTLGAFRAKRAAEGALFKGVQV